MVRIVRALARTLSLSAAFVASFIMTTVAVGLCVRTVGAYGPPPPSPSFSVTVTPGVKTSGGTVVTGIVNVFGRASEDLSVEGVQFKINGVSLGAEVTSGACGIGWNTTGGADGTYTITAIARDVASNTVASPPVTVKVDNTLQISGVTVSQITASTATVSWTTNLPSDSLAAYGPTTAYGSVTALNPALVTVHFQTFKGLAANTTYHFIAQSKSPLRGLVSSNDLTFRSGAFSSSATPASSSSSESGGSSESTRSGESSGRSESPRSGESSGTSESTRSGESNVTSESTRIPESAGSASSTSSCTTADPFKTMGGGTCSNGGWLPPGMVPPGGRPTTTPGPVPPSTSTPLPAAPSGAGGCITPDPFTGIPGMVGVCVNGGWSPVIR